MKISKQITIEKKKNPRDRNKIKELQAESRKLVFTNSETGEVSKTTEEQRTKKTSKGNKRDSPIEYMKKDTQRRKKEEAKKPEKVEEKTNIIEGIAKKLNLKKSDKPKEQ